MPYRSPLEQAVLEAFERMMGEDTPPPTYILSPPVYDYFKANGGLPDYVVRGNEKIPLVKTPKS